MKSLLGIFALFVVLSNGLEQEADQRYWFENEQVALKRAIASKPNTGVARNIILFIGDGMGVPSVTAGRILKGQLQGRSGEEEELSFDKMPHSGLIKTYCLDYQTSDSAATATAILAGVKTNRGVIGIDGRVQRGDCTAQATMKEAHIQSLLKLSDNEGKSTGIVTNMKVNDATPAAAYAHSADREWLDDVLTPPGCKDIALQLIEQNPFVEVVLGGGRQYFEPVTVNNGSRQDDRNLINEWQTEKTSRGLISEFVENRQQLKSVDPSKTDHLFGLFNQGHMDYELDKEPDSQEPSLSEMTEKSIQILQKNEKGFFLFVEGGRIDKAHHLSYGARALHEVIAFDSAVEIALKMTNQTDTLIIVTADHSHTMVIAGYQKRGTPILGLTDPAFSGTDGLPITTLLYGIGHGYEYGERRNLTGVDTTHKDFVQSSAAPRRETHGGEDVAVYALGPWSHLLTGVHEQSYIAHVMMYASCVGLNINRCAQDPNRDGQNGRFNKVLTPANSRSICSIALYYQAVFVISLAALVAVQHSVC